MLMACKLESLIIFELPSKSATFQFMDCVEPLAARAWPVLLCFWVGGTVERGGCLLRSTLALTRRDLLP